MTVPRVQVSLSEVAAGHLELSGQRGHYLSRVMRLRPGDRFRVFTARGDELEAEVTRIGYRRVSAKLLGPADVPDAEPKHIVCVALAVLKGEAMDWAIRKLTEVGAASIAPLQSQRVVATVRDCEDKLRRWKKIALEASRQCGRPRMPQLLQIRELGWFVEDMNDDGWFPWLLLDPDARDAVSVPDALVGAEGAGLIIGPEGDFTDEEKRFLVENGARPVYLGPRILRAETAAVVACALALYALGDLGPPPRPLASQANDS